MNQDRPKHIKGPLAKIYDEILPTLYADCPPVVIEALAGQTKNMRDARTLIEKDGAVVRDTKGNAVEHPALAIERSALKVISDLNKQWAIQSE